MAKTERENQDDFLLDAKRQDWTRAQTLEAKQWVHILVENNDIETLASLPKHYLYMISDNKLTAIKTKLDNMISKIDLEIVRRSV